MRIALALSLLNEIPLTLLPTAAALPWLVLLTLLAARWLPSPACGRAALALIYPALVFILLGVVEWTAVQPILAQALMIGWQPGQGAELSGMSFIQVGILWLAGAAFLAVAARRAPFVWPFLLAAGTLVAAACFAVPWLWSKSTLSAVDNALMAEMLSRAGKNLLRGLGPAAALALAWTPRTLPDGARDARQAPDEALPLRWFAALAAAVYLWRLALRLVHDWTWVREDIRPAWEMAACLSGHEVFGLAREGVSLALWAISVACWLLVAFRPGRSGRVWLVLLALAGLAGAWLADWGPVQWAAWRGFLP